MIGQKEERDARCELPEASGRADESSSSCVSTPSAKWEAPQSAPKTKSAPLSEKLVRKSSSQKQSQRNKKENSPTRDKSEQPKTKPGGVDMAGTDISGDDTAPKPSQNAPVRQISDPSFSKARGKRDCCASDPPPFEETSQSNHAMKTTAKDKPKNSSPTPTLPPMSSQHQPPRPTASPPPLRSTTTSRRGGLRSGARARSPLSTTPRGVPNSFSMGSPTASNNSFAVAPSNTHDQGAARPSAELTAMKPKGNTGYNAPPQGTGNIPVNNRGTSFPDQAKQSTSGLANENSLGFTSPNKKNISSAAANAAAAASASLATMQTTPNNKNQSDEHMKLSDGSFSPIDREDDLQELFKTGWPANQDGRHRTSHQKEDANASKQHDRYPPSSEYSAARETATGQQDQYRRHPSKPMHRPNKTSDSAPPRASSFFSQTPASLSTRGRYRPYPGHRPGHVADDRGHPSRHGPPHHRHIDHSYTEERRERHHQTPERSRSREYHRDHDYRGRHDPQDDYGHLHPGRRNEDDPFFERNLSFSIGPSSSYHHQDDHPNSAVTPSTLSSVSKTDLSPTEANASSVFRGRSMNPGPLSPPQRPRHSFDERGGSYHKRTGSDMGYPYAGSRDLSPVDPPQIQHIHHQRALSPQTFLLEKNAVKSPGVIEHVVGVDGGISPEEIEMAGSFGLFNHSFDDHSLQEAGMPPLDASFNQICGNSPAPPTPPHTPPYYRQDGRSPGGSLSRHSKGSTPLTPRGDISLPPFRRSSPGVSIHMPETPPTHYRSSSESTTNMYGRSFDQGERTQSPSPSFPNHDINTPSSGRIGYSTSFPKHHHPDDLSPRHPRHHQSRSHTGRLQHHSDYGNRSYGRGHRSDSYSYHSPSRGSSSTGARSNPNTPPRQITSRSYKVDRATFYKVLRNSSKAFEGCTFLLPGATSKTDDICNLSPKKDEGGAKSGPDKQKAAFMPEPATSNRVVGWPSPGDIIIAKRRVVAAICAFGGNVQRKDSSCKSSIFRKKDGEKEKKTPSTEKYEEKLKKRFYENESRISWEVEEKPPVETPAEKEDNESTSNESLNDKDKKEKLDNIKKENDNIEDGSPSSSSAKSPNSMARFLFLAGAEPPKMRYRCKLCGQPKQNHSCPYRQSLQRSIGVMVYPAINAFTSSEPGVLAPALSEMNNFADKKDTDTPTIEASPARSSGYGHYENTTVSTSLISPPHSITPNSLRGNVPGRSSVGSNGQTNSPQSSLSAGSLYRGGIKSRKRLHSQVSGDGGSHGSLTSQDLSAETPLFLDTMDIKPEQFRIVTPVASTAKKEQLDYTPYQYPSLPVPYKQRKRVSDSLFALSKEITNLTDECADVLREARATGEWDTAIAELMTQIIIGMRCQEGDNTLNGLSQYLLTIGIAC